MSECLSDAGGRRAAGGFARRERAHRRDALALSALLVTDSGDSGFRGKLT
jgi:hypothetical protein